MESDTIQAKLHARMPCGDDKEYRDVRRPAPEETARPVCRAMEKEGGSRIRFSLPSQASGQGAGPTVLPGVCRYNYHLLCGKRPNLKESASTSQMLKMHSHLILEIPSLQSSHHPPVVLPVGT